MASTVPPVSEEAGFTRLGKAFVKIKGVRLGRFVEFEFSLNDEDLTVELVLPFAAFEEFRARYRAELLPSDEAISGDLAKMAWRAGQPGLLRNPSLDGGAAER